MQLWQAFLQTCEVNKSGRICWGGIMQVLPPEAGNDRVEPKSHTEQCSSCEVQ